MKQGQTMQRSETTERKKKTNIQIEPQTIGLTEIETFTNRQIYTKKKPEKRVRMYEKEISFINGRRHDT